MEVPLGQRGLNASAAVDVAIRLIEEAETLHSGEYTPVLLMPQDLEPWGGGPVETWRRLAQTLTTGQLEPPILARKAG